MAFSVNDFKKSFKRISYLRFGKYADKWFIKEDLIGSPWVDKLKKEIKQAGWEYSIRGYIGMSIFGSLLGFLITFLLGIIFSLIISVTDNNPLAVGIGIFSSLIIGLIVGFFIFWLFRWVPGGIYIRDRRVSIDNALPTVASYMSAMTSSGVPPAAIFSSLAKEEIDPVITHEAELINRDIEILGLDILKALEQASFRSPSERWSGFIEGIIATVTSGGELSTYLATETKSYMKLKQEETKEFIEELGVMAEIFMVLGVVAPLFFVIMIAIVSILQTDPGNSILPLLMGIIYFVVPFLMIIVLILLSTTNSAMD